MLEMEVERGARLVVDAVDPGLDAFVAHGQEAGRHVEARGDAARDRGQRLAVREGSRSEQVRREVQVAESEPRVLGAEGPKLLGRAEGVAGAAPSPLAVERAAHPVRHRIRIG